MKKQKKLNMRNLLANKKLTRLLLMMIIAPMVMATSCEPEPIPCNDPTDPECPNYDPYYALRQDSIALTNQFRQDYNTMMSDAVLSNDFTPRLNYYLNGNNTLKDSVDATDLAIDGMHNDYGNPMTGATTEQNTMVDNTKQTCVEWFDVYAQLGHQR